MLRPARARVSPTAAITATNRPTANSLAPRPPSDSEKSRDSRTMAVKSAMVALAMVSRPTGSSTWPASFRTGMTRPREVPDRATASRSGFLTQSMAPNPSPTATASRSVRANPIPASRAMLPRSWARSISRPARNRRKARPISARIWMGRSTVTQPSTDGPTTMPATISSTTAGIRMRGTSPTRSGAATAIAATTSSPPNETSGIALQSRNGRGSVTGRRYGRRSARRRRAVRARRRRSAGRPPAGSWRTGRGGSRARGCR